MLQSLRPNAARVRKSVGKSVAPPSWGWDAISTQSEMPETHAVRLDNWFPQPGWVEIRGGYASWSTGMTDPVETLMPYHALAVANDKLFGVADDTIYNVTANGAASATTVTTLHSARLQHVQYTTSAGTNYLIYANGADSVGSFDGTTWAVPSITGLTSSTFINVNVFKKRLWFTIVDSMDAAYLPLDAIAGAATKFPLGSVMQKGGYLVAMATWTMDGGNGPDDYAVFISSRGQVAVYSGVDPAVDMVLVGVYELPPPIGYRCFTRVAGDIAVLTIGGVLPLSKALKQDLAAEIGIAITNRINNAMNVYAQSHKANFGWELTTFPLRTAAILNVPIAENTTSVQLVMNTITGAWCRFNGWDVNTFAVFKDNIYAGFSNGTVGKMWTGALDGTVQIDAIGQCAYNYFGKPGINKRFTEIQPNISTDQNLVPAVGLSTDFKDNAIISTPTTAEVASAIYDHAIYDVDFYAIGQRNISNWTTISGIGQCGSLTFRQTTDSTDTLVVQFNGFNITFETGEFI